MWETFTFMFVARVDKKQLKVIGIVLRRVRISESGITAANIGYKK
jgi:hypothetical protein